MVPTAFFWVFLALLLLGLPIVFALAAGPIVGFLLAGQSGFLQIVPQKLIGGINQFPLLAIPLFILAGELMNAGGITQRLIGLSNALVGHLRGGLAQVNILSSLLFAGLSGSAVADASALGSMLIPAMRRDGYRASFAAAVTAASAIIGPIIPPSIMLVIYAFVMQVSVGGLFLAGLVPGILLGLGLMLATRLLADLKDLPRSRPRASRSEVAAAARRGVLPLLTPVIVIGGIVGGVFTPTEAAGIAVLYALLLGLLVLRSLTVADLGGVFLRSVETSAVILVIIAAATLFGWAATLSGIPKLLAGLMLGLTDEPWLALLLANAFLLVVGMVLDAGPAVLIVGPILAPAVLQYGVEPLHFGIVMCINLSIGLVTPPMGLALFIVASVSGARMMAIFKEMLPYYLVHVVVVLAVTYVPALAMTLPRLFGFA